MIQIIVSRMWKNISLLLVVSITFVFLFLYILPRKICAQVVINEFQLSPSANQWLELINTGSEETNISGWVVDDAETGSAGVFTIPSGTVLLPQKCISFKSGSFNWNVSSADQVRLISPLNIEVYSYSKSPGENITIGRIVDGQGDLVILSTPSRDVYNSTGNSCVADIPVSSIEPTPTIVPTPTSYKSTYKINKPKSDGIEITGVQIIVDGGYIHHEDDEILYFYNGHECYTGIDCSLGNHTISLRKSGYVSWEDTQSFSAGTNLEVNPILSKLETSVSTASPTPVATPTKTPKPTSTKTPTATNTPASESTVLGIQEGRLKTPNPTTTTVEEEKRKAPILPFILIFGGFCFIAVPIFSIIRNAKKDHTGGSENKNSEIS